jgi:hypothetical protein
MRPTLLILVVLVVLMLAVTVGRHQAITQVWYLPGAAATAGQFGAQFSSTLTMTNVSASNTSVQVGFIPYAGKPTPSSVSRSLGAGETLEIPRVLESLFGLTADAGTLTVASEAPLILWLATTNTANPSGTYGLALQPISTTTLLPAGSTANAIWASQGNGYRTNVALTLLDPNSSVQLTVYDEKTVGEDKLPCPAQPPSAGRRPFPI